MHLSSPISPHQGKDQTTRLLTTSAFPGVQLPRKLAEDADGCVLAQMGMPRLWKSPVGHLKAFVGQMSSQAFTGSGRDPGNHLTQLPYGTDGYTEAQRGEGTAQRGTGAGLLPPRLESLLEVAHSLSGEEPMWMEQEVDSQGPAQRSQLLEYSETASRLQASEKAASPSFPGLLWLCWVQDERKHPFLLLCREEKGLCVSAPKTRTFTTEGLIMSPLGSREN